MSTLFYYVLLFLFVALGSMGLFSLMTPSRTQKRVQAVGVVPEKANWIKTVVQVVGPFAKLSAPDVKWETSAQRIKFINAGIRHDSAPLIFYGAKTLLPILFATLAYLFFQLQGQKMSREMLTLVLLIIASIACYLPNFIIWRIAARRKREILNNFPDAADLMLVCVEAGLGLDSALTKVAEEMQIQSIVLAQEIHLSNLEMRAGSSRERALRNLGVRTGVEEISTFAAMLSQADKFGTSIGESLRVFSDDLRHKRQIKAEELAAKVSTKMLFPLVLCIFPAISMVILGPAAIRIWGTILPMLSGQGSP